MSTDRQLAVRFAILASIFVGLLAYFVVPARAIDGVATASVQTPSSVAPVFSGEPCQVHPEFPEAVYQWCELITRVATSHGLDPDLIAALILQESGGDPTAYSKSGAVGLMQVMPRDGLAASFNCPNGPCFAKRPTIRELEEPVFNIEYGTQMLAGLISREGDVRDALKYYGPIDMGYRYADKVLAIWTRYNG
ncbi:MAG TPA: transglycosylase SLT domain-containing protein [Anaerolineales bacterium]|nr:transglycosylase SLT domain-containing protein [Anaerolineales bacterium]